MFPLGSKDLPRIFWSHLSEMRREVCEVVRLATERCISPRCRGRPMVAIYNIWREGLVLVSINR